ncbi:uncharacterized protein LOC133173051 [Saccostrea echinata]|uniref:uncharacterized protein LOC133173051 n=1 Tax=Saccostrea echinata TaxID=191078 RepID=UPI002A81ED91|nr:uncharacterized protein LOC133173051 [Saccostrea echinata]
MAGFWLTNKRITDLNIRHIYGGPEPFGKHKIAKVTRTFSLRTKEKEEQKSEALQRRMRRRLFDANSRGEYVVPRAPAFRELDQEGIEEIVTRLNHPKSAPALRQSLSSKSSSEESDCAKKQKTLSEQELNNVSIRLHNHETHMSRMRSGKGDRFPLPCSRINVSRSNSSRH